MKRFAWAAILLLSGGMVMNSVAGGRSSVSDEEYSLARRLRDDFGDGEGGASGFDTDVSGDDDERLAELYRSADHMRRMVRRGIMAPDSPSDVGDVPLIWDDKQILHGIECRQSRRFLRALVKSQWPSEVVDRWQGSPLLPELFALRGVEQDPGFHSEGDALVHTKRVMDAAADYPYERHEGILGSRLFGMLLANVHDFGKRVAAVYDEGKWRAYGHAELGVVPANTFLKRLGLPQCMRQPMKVVVAKHMQPANMGREGATRRAYKALAAVLRSVEIPMELMVRMAVFDTVGRGDLMEPGTSVRVYDQLTCEPEPRVEPRFDALVKFVKAAREARVLTLEGAE